MAMAKKNETTKRAEAFVRDVLAKSFNQKVDAETLRTVAEKVVLAVAPASSSKKVAA
jgi:hypothetical protein